MVDEELEDSKVLKALHQEMMDSVLLENYAGDGSIGTNVDTVSGDCMEQLDIPSASNFEEVDSKLIEAIEVAIE